MITYRVLKIYDNTLFIVTSDHGDMNQEQQQVRMLPVLRLLVLLLLVLLLVLLVARADAALVLLVARADAARADPPPTFTALQDGALRRQCARPHGHWWRCRARPPQEGTYYYIRIPAVNS